jgi:hypothetical protein
MKQIKAREEFTKMLEVCCVNFIMALFAISLHIAD